MDKQNYDLAEEDYINGMKYKEIAEKYNVSINTVKSWKTRYKWCKDKKSMHTKNKKVCTQSKKSAGAKKQNKEINKEPIADEVKEVMENDELNDKQRLFCIYYSKCFNATKSYLKAYTCTYETANVEGCKLLVKPSIKAQIDSLTRIRFNKEALKNGVLQKYIDIAFADLGDYVEFGKKQVPRWTKDKDGVDIPIVDPNTGEQKISEYSYVDLKDSISVDTSLISEVSEGKDGVKFKLADKMKALDFLTKHCNLLSDEEKIQLDIENKKLTNDKIKAEINRMSNKTGLSNDGELKDMLEGLINEL
ncbi:phage portal protein [Clostridium botulinum]|uniref:terminase small subunit n=1 Tax=Clostridium TaxID=1485 RepID=UPI0004FFE6FE|nr:MULTISPECIES: terminase small subunit [unclassified Clostridium]AIY79568.1 ATPase subunit of terminase family protein [Clostridium botulinum 202F]KAI3344249.1 terminase small subunit [Clostridium botulinum]KFX56081.1 phage portal protein [Clostridium botulinum]MBY6804269.1 terminase small subunit [Clostridium botulinum]MBY6813232.1 terminase small subunit [Clostridium botulinum]